MKERSDGRKPTLVVQSSLVRIHMRGVPHPKGGMYCPDDCDVYGDLLKAMIAKELPHDVRMEMGGGGQCIILFWMADAAKVLAWFAERGVLPVEEHPR